MFLLADSGSTKTDWCLIKDERTLSRVSTGGINPFYQTTKEIEHLLRVELIPWLGGNVPEKIFFYGAGCAFPEKNKEVLDAIAAVLHVRNIEINSDLLAASRALCGKEAGIACILGTGSNSCFYDGEIIRNNVSPLGFVLGDEGSGAVLGKRLVADCLKHQLPADLIQAFWDTCKLSRGEILERVYKWPFPNRFLASFTPFLLQHIACPEVEKLVESGLRDFLCRNVKQYDYLHFPVHFVGSVAWYFKSQLLKVANEESVSIGRLYQSPMEGLIAFHHL